MTSLQSRNRDAILGALNEVNERMNKLQAQLATANNLITQLQHELAQIKQEKLEGICREFGNGPTVK